MFSGKTSELIRRYNRYKIGGKKCLMIKYKNDDRYDSEMVVTHDNIKVNAIVCEYLYEADNQIHKYDVICIDEVQFYKDANIFCDKWANDGKIVEACGLNGTFNRTPFPMISLLLPLAEDIVFFKAICRETGEDAVYSKLNMDLDSSNENNTEIIGGSEKYDSVDRKTFFENKSNTHLIDFIKFYVKQLGYYDTNEIINFVCHGINDNFTCDELCDHIKQKSRQYINKFSHSSLTHWKEICHC
jgi:thymidine kinase